MNAFDSARRVEAESLRRLEPMLQEEYGGRYVFTQKGRHSRFVQEVMGDILVNHRDGRMLTIEHKAERKFTGNLFLERWSNRNLDDLSKAHERCKPGWLVTNRADLLFYHFLSNDKLFVCSLPALQHWAFVQNRVNDYEEKRQNVYNQPNDTWGWIAPIFELLSKLDPPARLVPVRQLLLDLETAA